MGAGHPGGGCGGGRDTDWRHDVIPALGTISGSALHNKALHTLDDLSPSKRSIALDESSALTSPGCDIPVHNWPPEAELRHPKAGLCWAVQTLLGMTLPKWWHNKALLSCSFPIKTSSQKYPGRNMTSPSYWKYTSPIFAFVPHLYLLLSGIFAAVPLWDVTLSFIAL